jgi:hypothetical protein
MALASSVLERVINFGPLFSGLANKTASRRAILKAKVEKETDFWASKLITRSSSKDQPDC